MLWKLRWSHVEAFMCQMNATWVSTQSEAYLTRELNNLIELSHRQPSTATKTFTTFTDIGLVQGLSGNDKHEPKKHTEIAIDAITDIKT